MPLQAELVHMRLYDLGAEVDLAQLRSVRGMEPRPAPMQAHSPVPQSTTFPQPYEVLLTPTGAPAGTRVEIRIHRTGVVAVRVRWPCTVEALSELARVAEAFTLDGAPLDVACRDLARGVAADIQPALRGPYEIEVASERYVAYCVHVVPAQVQRMLEDNEADLARLVSDAGEQALVPAREEAALRHTLQYTPGDAVVIGWDHAVILDGAGEYEDVLDVMELSNMELLEFRTYDAYLDRRLEGAFAALDRLWARGGLFRSARSALQDISQTRVEFARLTDNLHDTGKLFGDWYTAQVHRHLHERFHLSSWEQAVAAKMDTLEDMFHLAQEEANHRRTIVLEAMIVLLFVLDLVILVRLGG